MTTLTLLLLAIGLSPMVVGNARLVSEPKHRRPHLNWGAVLLCALAFNLTFFWQELWLVIPKALTPGLHPVLYHNDHDWSGHADDVELLQGTGALATLLGGLGFGALLVCPRGLSPTWRWFVFWMAFQGLFQALTQLAVGLVFPGNDVGRALGYLHVTSLDRWALLGIDLLALAGAGRFLARELQGSERTRALAQEMMMTALLATVLIIPFRLPRDIAEVAFVPLLVNLTGAGWLVLGASMTSPGEASTRSGRPRSLGPAIALGATLAVFQLILRRGVPF